jgi:hypothetical protein
MNISDIYARISMPAPPSGRVYHKRLFATQYTWYLVNTSGTRKVGCLIEDFRTAGRGKFKFGGQVRETDYSTAHAGSDPNYLGKASMESNAVVRCEVGHVGDGRRADSSNRFPGASSL